MARNLTVQPTSLTFEELIQWYRKRFRTVNENGTGLENLKKYYSGGNTREQNVANFYNLFNLLRNTNPIWTTALQDNDETQKDTLYSVFVWILGSLGLGLGSFANPFVTFVTSNTLVIPYNKARDYPQVKAWDKSPENKLAVARLKQATEASGVSTVGTLPPYFTLFGGSDEDFIKEIGASNLGEGFSVKKYSSMVAGRKSVISGLLTSDRWPSSDEYKNTIGSATGDSSAAPAELQGMLGIAANFGPNDYDKTVSSIANSYIAILEDVLGYAGVPKVTPFTSSMKFSRPESQQKEPKDIKASDIDEIINFAAERYTYVTIVKFYKADIIPKIKKGQVRTTLDNYKKRKTTEWNKINDLKLNTRSAVAFNVLMNFVPGEAVFKRPESDVTADEYIAAHEENQKKQDEALRKLAGAATPSEGSARQSSDATREEFRKNVYQCVLLAAMPWLQQLSIGVRTGRDKDGNKFKPRKGSKINLDKYYDNLPIPYGGRVIPVTIDPYQNSMNALNLPPVNDYEGAGLNQYLNADPLIVNDLGSVVSISKIVKNFSVTKRGKKVLINDGNEVKLPLNFTFAKLTESESGINYGKNFYIKSERKEVQTGPIYRDNIVLIKSIQVEFKGGNMATAKSDVEVKMSFVLPDITHIDYAFEDTVRIGKETYTYTYSFLDMLTYTNNNSVTGFASVFKDQYHPDYNRLLLESYVYYESKGTAPVEGGSLINDMLKQVPLVLDLAVVDHEIKKNSKTNEAEITINYRGYVDSAMTDPSVDALAGPDIVDARIDREEQVQNKLANGCTVDEIRKQIEINSQVSVFDNIRSLSRIAEKMTKDNRIYKVDVEDAAVKSSFNLNDDRIEKPWKILESLDKYDVDTDVERAILHQYIYLMRLIDKPLWDLSKEETAKLLKTGMKGLLFANGAVGTPNDYHTKYQILAKNAGAVSGKEKVDFTQKEKLRDMQFTDIKFFFFGDLVDTLLDGIHVIPAVKSGDGQRQAAQDIDSKLMSSIRNVHDRIFQRTGADGKYYFRPDPLKIILTSFEWFLPTETGKYQRYVTNLADVPISWDWFSEWFRQEIIEKKLEYYSINAFINALAQTVITRILGEVCFNVGTQHKTLFRATTDIGLFSNNPRLMNKYRTDNKTDLNVEFLKHLKTGAASQIKDSKGCLVYKYDDDIDRFPLLKKVPTGGTVGLSQIQKSSYCSYMIFYPANASSYEFQAKTNDYSAHDAGIPEFKFKKITTSYTENGYQHTNANALIESMDFSKQDAPYRREVKFFASNMGNLAQISGVYNVKITLAKAAYFLFPGQLIWVDAGVNGRPQNPKSMAHILGLGGYYQIVSVKHEIRYGGGTSPNTKTTVEASWVSYGMEDKNKNFNFYKRDLLEKKKSPKESCNSTMPSTPPNGKIDLRTIAVDAARRLQALNNQSAPQNNTVPNKPAGATTTKQKPPGNLPQAGTGISLTLSFAGTSVSVNSKEATVDYVSKETVEIAVNNLINPSTGNKVRTQSKYKLYNVRAAILTGGAIAEFQTLNIAKSSTGQLGPQYLVQAYYSTNGELAFISSGNYLLYSNNAVLTDLEEVNEGTSSQENNLGTSQQP